MTLVYISTKIQQLWSKCISGAELVSGGFFCLDKVWEKSCLPSGHQRDHADSSFVQLGRDYCPGPSLSAENSKVRELKRQAGENRKFVKNGGKYGQRQDLISNQWAGCSYATKRISEDSVCG